MHCKVLLFNFWLAQYTYKKLSYWRKALARRNPGSYKTKRENRGGRHPAKKPRRRWVTSNNCEVMHADVEEPDAWASKWHWCCSSHTTQTASHVLGCLPDMVNSCPKAKQWHSNMNTAITLQETTKKAGNNCTRRCRGGMCPNGAGLARWTPPRPPHMFWAACPAWQIHLIEPFKEALLGRMDEQVTI